MTNAMPFADFIIFSVQTQTFNIPDMINYQIFSVILLFRKMRQFDKLMEIFSRRSTIIKFIKLKNYKN